MKKLTKKNKKKEVSPLQAARTAMRAFAKYKAEKAVLEEKQRKAKATLYQFALDNRQMFDESGNFNLPGGYLHFGEKTVVKPCEGFDMNEFVKEFPELVDQVFRAGAVKNILQDEKGREKLLQNHCVELVKDESFDIIVKA